MTLHPPPNLQTLTNTGAAPFTDFTHDEMYDHLIDDPECPLSIPFFRAPSSVIPASLRTLDVVVEDSNRSGYFNREHCRKFIEDTTKHLKTANSIDLRAWAQDSPSRHNFFPPYLHGEAEDPRVRVYNPDEGKWLSRYARPAPPRSGFTVAEERNYYPLPI
jgi:hypothetical protein